MRLVIQIDPARWRAIRDADDPWEPPEVRAQRLADALAALAAPGGIRVLEPLPPRVHAP